MDDFTANPAPTTTATDVFDKVFNLAGTLGGIYLTQQGQQRVANAASANQARVNSYGLVNPSLGPVDPAAAARVAGETWIQRWLPGGSPTVGVSGTGTNPQTNNTGKIVLSVVIGLLAVYIVIKLFRKL